MRPVSMVGLSVLLEDEQRSSSSSDNSNAGFIKQAMVNKAAAKVVRIGHFSSSSSYVIPPCLSSPRQLLSRPSVFLDVCFLCKNNLLPGKDIYMYKGDRGFCSVECRSRQILLDEQAAAAGSSDHSSSSPASLSDAVKL